MDTEQTLLVAGTVAVSIGVAGVVATVAQRFQAAYRRGRQQAGSEFMRAYADTARSWSPEEAEQHINRLRKHRQQCAEGILDQEPETFDVLINAALCARSELETQQDDKATAEQSEA